MDARTSTPPLLLILLMKQPPDHRQQGEQPAAQHAELDPPSSPSSLRARVWWRLGSCSGRNARRVPFLAALIPQ